MQLHKLGIDVGSTTAKVVILDNQGDIVFSRYERHNAQPIARVLSFLQEARQKLGQIELSATVTGSVGMKIAEIIHAPFMQEVVAASRYVQHNYSSATAMIDIGGEDAKIVFFDGSNTDLRMNGNCAGGTGAFIDQMAVLLNIETSEMDSLAAQASHIHPIAARCGVFSKTDIQNLMSRNASKSDIAASIFHAVAVQTMTSLARGHDINTPILLCGGPLTFISSLRKAFAKYLQIEESDFILPQNGHLIPALGCALSHHMEPTYTLDKLIELLQKPTTISIKRDSLPQLFTNEKEYKAWKEIKCSYAIPQKELPQGHQEAFLGIDSGSTTTKIVVTDADGALLFTHYAPNNGNPIEAAKQGLLMLQEECNKNKTELTIKGSCSTGYGEELIKAALGLNSSMIETLAHYRAAQKLLPDVSFILDIGGQDMKAIFIENGTITRMELNEACSSGCGSFIETFARTLNYKVADFAHVACTATSPYDLGTRCTVFMNSKVKQALREGASIPDISAGLSYSVVKNCLYKVLKIKDNRTLGKHIVVQGGTMRNDAIVRAFEQLTHTHVARSNYPELMGAYGCALSAIQHPTQEHTLSALLSQCDFTTRQTECHGCENRCSICRYIFPNGNTFFSGNKCENIFSNHGKSSSKGTNIYQEKYSLLFDRRETTSIHKNSPVIGIPRALNSYENYPFWHTLFAECGIRTVLSAPSTFEKYEKALQSVMSDNICFPAKLTHSHIKDLLDKGVDRIFMPYVVYERKDDLRATNSYNCPIVSGYSDVIRNSMTPDIPIDAPAITFADDALLTHQCIDYLKSLGIKRAIALKAIIKALEAQDRYNTEIQQRAEAILKESRSKNRITILLAGRPYHTDPLIQHKISNMIADLGADVISEDIIRNDTDTPVDESYLVQQWSYINRILKAASWVARQNNRIHFVQITSFGCGPDAFLLDEVRDILHRHGKPFTLLKVDDVNNIGSLKLRMRSLIESLQNNDNTPKEEPFVTTAVFKKKDRRKKILAPFFSEYISPLLPPLFQLIGYDVEVLPPDDMESAEVGLKYANNEVCYPATVVTGSLIKALQSGRYDLDNTAVAITQTGGQCRATNYVTLVKRALVSAGFTQVPVITLGIHGNVYNEQEGFNIPWRKILSITLNAVLYADTLSRFYHSTVVREKCKGVALALRDIYLQAATIPIKENNPQGLLSLIERAAHDFDNACIDRECPQVGIVGEIYLKFNAFSHQHIIDYLIEQNIEVCPPALLPLFTQSFINMETNRRLQLKQSLTPAFFIRLLHKPIAHLMKKYNQAASDFRYFMPFNSIYEDAENARPIVSPAAQFGEGWLLPGEVATYVSKGINNVISLQPFGCIANHILSKGAEKRLRTLYPQLNFLSLDFDSGVSEVNVINRVYLFTNNLIPNHQ